MTTMQDIAAQVTAETGVTLEQMRDLDRAKGRTAARQRAWRQARHRLGASFPEIGRFFRRDPSTIIAGIRMDEKRHPDRAAELMELAIRDAAKLAVRKGVGVEALHNRLMDAYREAQA